MRTRSKYWYISLVLFLIFNTNVEAKDICNDTNYEQVITDGENEQYIPPHMCVTVIDGTSEVVNEENNETINEVMVEAEIPEEDYVVEVKEEQTVEVQEVDNAQNSENETLEENEEESEKKYFLIIPIVISVLILMVKKARK